MARLVVTAVQVDAFNAARARRVPCTLPDAAVARWLEHALPMLERESRAALTVPPASTATVAALGEQAALTVRGAFVGLDRAELATLTDVLARQAWAWLVRPLLAGPDAAAERARALEAVYLAGAGAGLHLT